MGVCYLDAADYPRCYTRRTLNLKRYTLNLFHFRFAADSR